MLPPGSRLGPYEILDAIGAGGMGEVYRARDTRLDRTVALKILAAHGAADPEFRERFEREARSVAALSHPNICILHDVGRDQGVDYLVMEYLEGDTLEDRLRAGPLPVADAVAVARQIAAALDAAHEKGILHRDLKPANIKIVPDGQVKVLDFGLAKSFASASSDGPTVSPLPSATRMGVAVGTPAYMSPEQARGLHVDRRTDVWAFGCVLFEMLTGGQPFGGPTISDSIAAVLDREPDWTRLPVSTPGAVRRVLQRCLAKDPKRRARDVGDILLDLEAPLDVPLVSSHERRAWQIRWALVAPVVAILAGAAFVAGARWRASRVHAPVEWQGELLAGPAVAMVPRVSPDGQTVAFQAMEAGLTQVGVMKPQTGNWRVLTRDRSRGQVQDMCWSPDGTKIYFDRFFDVPRGIFSIPVLGGDERLVLEDAMGPRALADGSLLVVKINAERRAQLYRFWPEAGRLEALPALLSPSSNVLLPALTVFRDGREAVFLGRPADLPEDVDHLFALDLLSGRARRLAPSLTMRSDLWAFPLATASNAWVLLDVAAGNLHAIVAIPRDGSDEVRRLVTVTARALAIDATDDGSLYVDQIDQPLEIFAYRPASAALDRMPVPGFSEFFQVLPLPDGRMLVSTRSVGRDRLVVLAKGKDAVPFVDTQEETAWPMTMVGNQTVAFFSGSLPNRVLTLASVADGRIVRRITRPKLSGVRQLAGSPDGTTIFYAALGTIWAIPSMTDGDPRRVHAGDGVAVDPGGRYLVILQAAKEGVRLVRVPIEGGAEEPIVWKDDLRIPPNWLAPNAVGRDGRIAVRIITRDSWFWPAALIEPRTGRVERTPPGFEIDMNSPGWTNDGRVLSIARFLRSSLWRFKPSQAPLE